MDSGDDGHGAKDGLGGTFWNMFTQTVPLQGYRHCVNCILKSRCCRGPWVLPVRTSVFTSCGKSSLRRTVESSQKGRPGRSRNKNQVKASNVCWWYAVLFEAKLSENEEVNTRDVTILSILRYYGNKRVSILLQTNNGFKLSVFWEKKYSFYGAVKLSRGKWELPIILCALLAYTETVKL